MTSLQQKLGLKPTYSTLIINPPPNYFDLIESDSLLFVNESIPYKMLDFIHIFCNSEGDLMANLHQNLDRLKKDGMIWISWLKGHKTFNREKIRAIGLTAGLVDVKVASINEQWSGLKFVYRLKDRNQ